MKAHQQIKITMNSNQFGFEKNKQQIIPWLHSIIPVILREQKVITEEIFLHTMKQHTNVCLN
ncbi:MAG TPA: hypothetical protein VH396_02485 [Chitinophagaceae bacterium]